MSRTITLHPLPVCQQHTDDYNTLETDRDRRKFYVGAFLVFRNYDQQEVRIVACSTFKRGDLLQVQPTNRGEFGIIVKRLRDGKEDMVWPNEVTYRRVQAYMEVNSRYIGIYGPTRRLAVFDKDRCLVHGDVRLPDGTYDQFRSLVKALLHYEIPKHDPRKTKRSVRKRQDPNH